MARAAYFLRRQVDLDRCLSRIEAGTARPGQRAEAIEMLIVDFDNPVRAAELMTPDVPEPWRTRVPLAAKAPGDLALPVLREMGGWYAELAAEADPVVQAALLDRADSYYRTWLDRAAPDDPARDAVEADRDAARKASPDYVPEAADVEIPEALREWVAKRDELKPEAQARAIAAKLREYNGGKAVRFDYRANSQNLVSIDLSGNPRLEGLEPLIGLPLKRLNVDQCPRLKSFKGLEGMPLEHLSANRCESLSGDCKRLAGMPLKGLCLAHTKISSLDGLEGMPLRGLNLWETPIASLAPLKKVESLTWLVIGHCNRLRSLDGIQHLPLRQIDVRRCMGRKWHGGDMMRLKNAIPTLETVTYHENPSRR